MTATRENVTILYVGRKHTGKSTDLAKMALDYPKESKVLIIDVNSSPAYNHGRITQLAKYGDLKRWKNDRGIVKIPGVPTEEDLNFISEKFRNGLIIFEDCTKYIFANPSPMIKKFLVDHRMYGCDLVFTFHSFRRIPIQFWEMSSYITIKKTQDTWQKSWINRIPNSVDVEAAFKRVMAHENNYYHETVATLV